MWRDKPRMGEWREVGCRDCPVSKIYFKLVFHDGEIRDTQLPLSSSFGQATLANRRTGRQTMIWGSCIAHYFWVEWWLGFRSLIIVPRRSWLNNCWPSLLKHTGLLKNSIVSIRCFTLEKGNCMCRVSHISGTIDSYKLCQFTGQEYETNSCVVKAFQTVHFCSGADAGINFRWGVFPF